MYVPVMVIFITGTDTDCGKTFVSSLLLKAFIALGIDASYQKWVSTGNRDYSEDAHFVYEMAGITPPPMAGSLETPYCFSLPASPHLAGEQDGQSVDTRHLEECTRILGDRHELVIVEGVGGLLVPLTRETLLIDLVAQMSLPTIVVARAGLGTINHTLLTIEALERRGIEIRGLIINEDRPANPLIAQDNQAIIEKFTGISPLCRIPHQSHIDNSLIDELKEAAKALYAHH